MLRSTPRMLKDRPQDPQIPIVTQSLLFDGIERRIALDKEDGDYAYFHALSLKLEYVTKVATAGVLACVTDDVDRHRYSIEHKLVRADSIGAWADALNMVLTGPAVHLFDQSARSVRKDLSERVGPDDWRYAAIEALNSAASEVGSKIQTLGTKVALRQFFDIAAKLRNRSRGHGAPTSQQCGRACPSLSEALDLVVHRLELFKIPWAFLHRNISGKYRVSGLVGDAAPFGHLKSAKDENYPDGVFIYVGRPVLIPLVLTDPDVLDIFLPNGNHRNNTLEVLSYVTNEADRRDASAWSAPPGHLPPSETEGSDALEPLGKSFANVPPPIRGYISRSDLEDDLRKELLRADTHPIVTLTGPGGIGKTTIAIAAIHEIANGTKAPYDVILWISARDVDLLESGPKSVAPRVITQQDIARAAADLLDPSDKNETGFDAVAFFQRCLREGAAGNTLFVIDNFETVQNPVDVYRWIDTHIRPDNKVLITTRFRDFAADYPIEIGGMTEEQANRLIDQRAGEIGVSELMTARYRAELIQETDGHPYVIKILLGEVARERRTVKPKRIVANSEYLLKALFERTYGALSPGGKRVFLLLSSWRVAVPEVAVEAVLLRPGTERFDVTRAIEELSRFSFIDRVESEEEGVAFVSVPLAATMYGRSKLDVSPIKLSVEEDRRLLMEFGPGRGRGVGQQVLPRIEHLIRGVAVQARSDEAIYEKRRPVLEYLAARVPRAYLQLAELALEVGESEHERAKEYVRLFLEGASGSGRLEAWLKLATICQLTGDPIGEVHATSEAAILAADDLEDLGKFANRLNFRIRDLRRVGALEGRSTEVRGFLEGVIREMESRLSLLSATNCSRLAWLYLNVGNSERALDVARIGIDREPENEHCAKLMMGRDA